MKTLREPDTSPLSSGTEPWFEAPDFSERLENEAFDAQTKALLRQYAEEGFLLVDFELPDFETLAARVIEELAPKYGGRPRIIDAWEFNDAVRRIASCESIKQLLRTIYRREPFPFQTLNFPHGTQQPAHSDTIHFHTLPPKWMCGVWVALEDADEDNGPLFYYPGSHRLPVLTMQDLGLPGQAEAYPAYEKYIQDAIRRHGLKPRLATIRKGRAVVWSANILHGGSPIRDRSRSRHSQVTHYFFEGCRYFTPLLSDTPAGKIFLRSPVDISTGREMPGAGHLSFPKARLRDRWTSAARRFLLKHPRLAEHFGI